MRRESSLVNQKSVALPTELQPQNHCHVSTCSLQVLGKNGVVQSWVTRREGGGRQIEL